MKKLKPLNYKFFRRKLNPRQLRFKTTDDISLISNLVGQERALDATKFGIGIKKHGYNLYAMGPPGVGKRSLISIVLSSAASKENVPSDWCYIYNFTNPEKPIALALPPGMGIILQQDMKTLIDELGTSILAVFESDEYNAGSQEIQDDFNAKREKLDKKIVENPKNLRVPKLYKERHQKEKELLLKFSATAIEPCFNKFKKKYEKYPEVLDHLKNIQDDVLKHVTDFVKRDETTDAYLFAVEAPILINYQVNLFVDNSQLPGAPIVYEENPTYYNLICRIEHAALLGTMATNFTLIRPGAIHKANGGYLIIDAKKLKKEKHSWEALKRALYTRKIRIEPIELVTEAVRPVSLEPMSIPLDIKVVLMGDRATYYDLSNHDSDFNQLFKVTVDFDEVVSRTKGNLQLYARLIGTIIHEEGLKPFSAAAVAEIIDYSSRIAEDIEKLTTHMSTIKDLIVEADYWANVENHKIVEREDVQHAQTQQVHRRDRNRELYYEDIMRDFILINTKNELIGQLNSLSVVKVGNFSYGHPTRVTAKVRMGKDKLIDIQREIKMAGPMHSKASLTIANYLSSRYIPEKSFYLSASISFEQIYGRLDGDSASVAELCALLSAISKVPLKQSLAVTGSINQCGDVQAIGGVNEKIEGFFDICKAKGLKGNQGVLIPEVNVKNLMLREDILEAAKAKKFSIYTINTADEALYLLTGMQPGERNKSGKFPKNTVNYLVEQRLKKFIRIRMKERKKKVK